MKERDEVDPLALAKECMKSVHKLDAVVGDLDILYSNFDQYSRPEIKEELKGNIGQLLSVSFDLVNSIVRKYPELDPDKD